MTSVMRFEMRAGVYFDSVVLMQLQRGLAGLAGVLDAGIVMATPANRELLAGSDLLPPAAQRASADDLWLHARDVPGAHVIIPTAEGLPSEEDVFWAASIAAYYSRARHDTSVEVDVTIKKYVRAIKGATPGLVTYRNETTLRVAPEAPDDE